MERHITFDRLHNFRDLGGYSTQDGRTVQWGRLYRSDSLGKLHGEDWKRFLQLDIQTVIDLRYPWEIEAKGRIPADDAFTYHNLSIEHRAYDQAALTAEVDPAPYLAARYAEVTEDGVAELHRALSVIAENRTGATVFHCASGKDRTGIVGALVLGLLGVPESDIIADFALTGLATDRLAADWQAENPDRVLAWPWYGHAPAALMRLFLDDLTNRHGSLHGYAATQLGVDHDLIEAIRARLLTAAPPP